MLRPFKLLFDYEEDIRGSLADVEALLDAPEASKADLEKGKGMFNDQEFQIKDLIDDLKLLIEFMDTDLKATFDLRRSIKDGIATEIEYADLWHLFQLGDTVITRSRGANQAFRVVNFTGGRNPLINRLDQEQDRAPPIEGFAVDCVSIQFDGTDYVPTLEKFSIRKFSGRRPITSLEVYPLNLEENADQIRKRLVAQGRHYVELTQLPFSHRMFKGKTMDEPPQELVAQVTVDLALAIAAEPDWRPAKRILEDDLTANDLRETQIPPVCEHSRFDEGCCGSDHIVKDLVMNFSTFSSFRSDYGGLFGPRSAHELKEDDLLLLPSWVRGFVLRSRQWVTMRMDDLSEVQHENDFDELMISNSHKQAVLALVENHENARQELSNGASTIGASLDLVKGKGSGLILLLHGEPGVGKTSTAECVADKTKRPLFPITCGDIGETAMDVERNLHHNFRLAFKWGCVLLLDEADVFLAKRNKTDLRRNAVTSVFLRSLEYYAGILFLTTNRVGSIDPAFKSRIHLSLYYPRLDIEATVRIYEIFLKRTQAAQKASGVALFKVKNKEILRFARRHYRSLRKEGYTPWNGRQIRNAFQTAIALVEAEAAHKDAGQPKPILGKSQFDIVAEGSKEFDTYLMKTLSGTDDEIAIRDEWRNDGFSAGSVLNHSRKGKTVQLKSKSSIQSESSDSEEDEDTESDDEDEDEDDDGDDEEINRGKAKETKASAADPAPPPQPPKAEANEEMFAKFLKFQAMMEAEKKR